MQIDKTPQAPDIFRMEKSVITHQNIRDLTNATGDHVAESLIYHICYQHQHDLFGYGKVDPDIFGKQNGFSRQYLNEIVKDPFQLRISPSLAKKTERQYNTHQKMDQPIYNTRIENAFYALGNMPLTITTTIVDNETKLIRRVQFTRILKEFYIEVNKITGKKTYTYKLEEYFRRNLSSYYLNSSRATLISLRKSGLGPLYQHILRLKEALFAQGRTSTDTTNTPNFAYLCEISMISKNLQPKHQKDKLKKAFEKIKKHSNLRFDIEWVKGKNEKERYTPIFHFNPTLNGFVEPDSRYYNMNKKDIQTDIVSIEFIHNLLDRFPYENYDNFINGKNEEKFFNWLTTPDTETIFEFRKLLTKAYTNTGTEHVPTDISKRIQKMQEFAAIKPHDEIYQWMKEIVTLRTPFPPE